MPHEIMKLPLWTVRLISLKLSLFGLVIQTIPEIDLSKIQDVFEIAHPHGQRFRNELIFVQP